MNYLSLFLFLICVAFIAYFIYDHDKNDTYLSFLLKKDKIGDFLIRHEFIYFMVCFFSTATLAIGAIYFLIKLLENLIL